MKEPKHYCYICKETKPWGFFRYEQRLAKKHICQSCEDNRKEKFKIQTEIICSVCKESKSRIDFNSYQARQKDSICKTCNVEVKKTKARECQRKYRDKKTIQTPETKYKIYKEGAEKRNLLFKLTFEEFISFWQKPCSYCGTQIETIGLDRVDNSIGYRINNVVSCCWTCNCMKRSYSKEKFISHIEKIYLHLVKQPKN